MWRIRDLGILYMKAFVHFRINEMTEQSDQENDEENENENANGNETEKRTNDCGKRMPRNRTNSKKRIIRIKKESFHQTLAIALI